MLIHSLVGMRACLAVCNWSSPIQVLVEDRSDATGSRHWYLLVSMRHSELGFLSLSSRMLVRDKRDRTSLENSVTAEAEMWVQWCQWLLGDRQEPRPWRDLQCG